MKKLFLVLVFIAISASAFAESRMTIGLWVNMTDGGFRTRVVNEITSRMNNSEEWPFGVIYQGWDADIHVIVSGMRVPNSEDYAWSVTYTPIYYPRYTNGTVATTAGNISGMNWIARSVVQYVEEQLYYLMDDLTAENL